MKAGPQGFHVKYLTWQLVENNSTMPAEKGEAKNTHKAA